MNRESDIIRSLTSTLPQRGEGADFPRTRICVLSVFHLWLNHILRRVMASFLFLELIRIQIAVAEHKT